MGQLLFQSRNVLISCIWQRWNHEPTSGSNCTIRINQDWNRNGRRDLFWLGHVVSQIIPNLTSYQLYLTRKRLTFTKILGHWQESIVTNSSSNVLLPHRRQWQFNSWIRHVTTHFTLCWCFNNNLTHWTVTVHDNRQAFFTLQDSVWNHQRTQQCTTKNRRTQLWCFVERCNFTHHFCCVDGNRTEVSVSRHRTYKCICHLFMPLIFRIFLSTSLTHSPYRKETWTITHSRL